MRAPPCCPPSSVQPSTRSISAVIKSSFHREYCRTTARGNASVCVSNKRLALPLQLASARPKGVGQLTARVSLLTGSAESVCNTDAQRRTTCRLLICSRPRFGNLVRAAGALRLARKRRNVRTPNRRGMFPRMLYIVRAPFATQPHHVLPLISCAFFHPGRPNRNAKAVVVLSFRTILSV